MRDVPAPEQDPTTRALTRALVLLIRYSIAGTRIARETLGPDGVTNRDVRLLLALSRHSGLTPSVLAARLGVSRSVVSHSLRRFQGNGLVRRDVNPSDHRVFRLVLTAKGQRSVDTFQARLAEWFTQASTEARELLAILGPAGPGEPQIPDHLTPLDAIDRLGAAGSAYVAEVTPLLEPFGINLATDRFALTLIGHHQQMRPAQLAEALDLTPSGTSTMLDRLEHAALIERTHNSATGDRRAVQLSLTPTGHQAAALAIEVLHRHAASLHTAIRLTTRVRLTTGAA